MTRGRSLRLFLWRQFWLAQQQTIISTSTLSAVVLLLCVPQQKEYGTTDNGMVLSSMFCGEGQTEGATWSATLQQGLIQR
jgi:hypothetical protein